MPRKEAEMLEKLCPRLRASLEARGLGRPTPIQAKAFAYISLGAHVVISSPTGTGKTEAALIPIYDYMCRHGARRISVLYVTPLRALNRDILRRVLGIAGELGIDAALRHGDTTPKQRKAIAEKPPHILVTTPETLQYLLLDSRYRAAFRNLRWIIVDELHELMGSKRGSELTVVLERLERIAGHRIQRIGLSATLGAPEEAARFLGGPYRHVHVVAHSGLRELEITVVEPHGSPQAGDKGLPGSEVEARVRWIANLIKETQGKVLVFANTRDTAEFLASRLAGILGPQAVRVHHGSLSRAERIEAESLFREGKIRALVATSSMELGIDIGDVDLVVQYMSPRQASRLVQRVGRSRHRVGEKARGIIVSSGSMDDTLESMVIAARAKRGDIETPLVYEAPLDALAHQIAGMVLEKRRVRLAEVYEVVSRAWPYRDLDPAKLEEVACLLDRLGIVRIREGFLAPGRRIYSYYYGVTMIPDRLSLKAVDIESRRTIGRLDADFVASRCEEGALIILGGRVWRVIGVEDDKVYLSREELREGILPAWEGELIPVDGKVSREVCSVYRRLLDGGLSIGYPVEQGILQRIRDTLLRHVREGHPVPGDHTLYVESSGNTGFVHACLGSRGNELLGILVSGMYARLFGLRVAYRATPYRVMLVGEGIDAQRIKQAIEMLASMSDAQIEELSRDLSRITGMYRWKLLQVAKRMGLVEPGSEAVLSRAMLRHLTDTLAGEEAWKEMLVDKLDLRLVLDLLGSIRRGSVRVVAKKVAVLSPLSRDTLEHVPGFLDYAGAGLPRGIVSEVVKRRLLNRKMRFICLLCGHSWVARIGDLQERISCPRCGAGFVAMVRVDDVEAVGLVRKVLGRERLSGPEKARLRELKSIGGLILSYGKPAAIAMSAYGVGPKTAARLIRSLKYGESAFYAAIADAERQFIRTRQYWGK